MIWRLRRARPVARSERGPARGGLTDERVCQSVVERAVATALTSDPSWSRARPVTAVPFTAVLATIPVSFDACFDESTAPRSRPPLRLRSVARRTMPVGEDGGRSDPSWSRARPVTAVPFTAVLATIPVSFDA